MAAWSEGAKRTGEDGGDVFETVHEGAAVNVIERISEEPLFLCIIDLETTVWGDAGNVSCKKSLGAKSFE